MELLHNHALGPERKKVVSQARSLGVTWICLEDHLREQRVRVDDILSSTLMTAQPTSDDRVFLYQWKVCRPLDTLEGRGTVVDHVLRSRNFPLL